MRSSARLTARLWKSSIRVATSGKMSSQRNTKRAPVRRAVHSAARPTMGGSVSETTTSGRPTAKLAAVAAAK